MLDLNELERAILELTLAGDDPVLRILRDQLSAATITSREMTGAGFYTGFAVPDQIERVPRKNFDIGDVCAEINGLAHGAGFVLFVRNGMVSWLEGFTYGEEGWPDVAVLTESYFVHHEPPDSPMLRRCNARDLDQLRQQFSSSN